jgi:nitrate reductase delta subunit
MVAGVTAHDGLAELLTYPGEGYLASVARVRHTLGAGPGAAEEQIAAFAAGVESLSTDALRELFTTTFDLNPVCALEVGWHLYGETYDRGEFLVKARGILRECAIAESGELPDHLSYLIQAVQRLDAARASELAATTLLPAVTKMQTALAGKGNPYEHLLAAVRTLVAADAGVDHDRGPAAVHPFPAPERTT